MSNVGMEELAAGRSLDVPERYREFSIGMVRRFFSLQKPVPRQLFHYTSLAAMKSIIEGGSLWASHAAYLNDSSELAYSHSILGTVVREIVVSEETVVGREYLQRTLHAIDPFDGMREVFLLCFCEDGDLLSQWRSYGTNASGYSLGLDGAELNAQTRFSVHEEGKEYELQSVFRKVNYDRTEHVSIVRDVVTSILAILKAHTAGMTVADANTLIAEAIGATRDHLFEFYPCFKDPGFREENEWRLIFSFAPSADRTAFWKFRPAGTNHLVPYLDIRCAVRAGIRMGRLPLGCVTVGPVAAPGIAETAVRLFLNRHAYHFAHIARSQIPLR